MYAMLSGCANKNCDVQKYHPDMMNYYTRLLIEMNGGGAAQEMAERMSTGANAVSVERRIALAAIAHVYPNMKKTHPESYQSLLGDIRNLPGVPRSVTDSRVERTADTAKSFDTTMYVDMEAVLSRCMDVWELESTASVTIAIRCVGMLQSFARMAVVSAAIRKLKKTKQRLEEVYNEFDEDGDGNLTFSEFSVMVKAVAPQMNQPEKMIFFNECLEISETQLDEMGDEIRDDDDSYTITMESFVGAAMDSRRVEAFTQNSARPAVTPGASTGNLLGQNGGRPTSVVKRGNSTRAF
jgi:hypothetical protein